MTGAAAAIPARTTVLLSGGPDSTALLALAMRSGAPSAVFVDYGQRARERERTAARSVCDYFSIPLVEVSASGFSLPEQGEITGRNAFLVLCAALRNPGAIGLIAIGIHDGSDYPDCSPAFVQSVQAVLDLHLGKSIRLAAPFLGLTKAEVIALGEELRAPMHLTYSCDAGGEPCGDCPSCRTLARAKGNA